MKIELRRYLDDLEERLNAPQEKRILGEWLNWARRENTVGPFAPEKRIPSPSRLEWPHVNINDALTDDDLSIYRELEGVHRNLAAGTNSILRIRANYGVGNVATAFGAPLFVMPYETDTLPNVRALGGDRARALAEGGLPPIDAGNFASIFRILDRFREIRRDYPRIAQFVRIEQPDLQGPMDNLELVWGSSLFYALYDEPETVHALLTLFTRFMERFMDCWLEMFPNEYGIASYFRHIEKGAIAVRDDSAMNLSPEFYEEFIAPYDGELLKKYGGLVHFCGRGDHYIEKLASLEGLNGVNMSQPHLNDMEKVFSATIDRGIHLSISAPSFPVRDHDVRNLVFLP